VPTDAAEGVGEFAQIGDRDHAVATEQQRDPPHGRAVVFQRRVLADEQNEAQGVGQVDVSELGRGGEREVRVARLDGAPGLGRSVALRGQGKRMFAEPDSLARELSEAVSRT